MPPRASLDRLLAVGRSRAPVRATWRVSTGYSVPHSPGIQAPSDETNKTDGRDNEPRSYAHICCPSWGVETTPDYSLESFLETVPVGNRFVHSPLSMIPCLDQATKLRPTARVRIYYYISIYEVVVVVIVRRFVGGHHFEMKSSKSAVMMTFFDQSAVIDSLFSHFLA